jgi:hypothetical protein
MLTWLMLRQAALARHAAWNVMLEGSDPELWRAHRDMVDAVYSPWMLWLR